MMRKESRDKIDSDVARARRWLDEIAYNPPLTCQEYELLLRQWDDTLHFTRMSWYDRMEQDATSCFRVGFFAGVTMAAALFAFVTVFVWTM